MSSHHVYREADGVWVKGTSRPVFVHNIDTYHLSELVVFADGLIDCWGPTDLDGLREQLASGRVATDYKPGARASALWLGGWKFADPLPGITAEELLGELADEIDKLNDRPDSQDRCRAALNAYLAERTPRRLAELRRRYLAVPGHLRGYILGDMDAQDWPLRYLTTPIGELTGHHDDEDPITAAEHAQALEYLGEWEAYQARSQPSTLVDGPENPQSPTVTVECTVYPGGWPQPIGRESFQIQYPAAVAAEGRTYPSVEHAYWALSTTDAAVRAAIAEAEHDYEARQLAASAPRRGDWPLLRQAVMLRLLRDKYSRNPELARLLLDTGDGRIIYHRSDSTYWSHWGPRGGNNWLGRLLEIVRSELAVERAGLG